MIRHDAFLELAAVAIDFELSAAERTRLEAHLATCPVCLRAASALHADARSLATLPPVRLAERRADALLAGVLATPRAALGSLRLLAVAALLVVLAVGGILVGAELLRRATDDYPLVVVPSPSTSVDPDASPVAGWAAVPVPESEAAGRFALFLEGVSIGPDGMVAYGGAQCRDDDTDCRLTVLWSADGTAWSVVPAQPSLATEPHRPTSGPLPGVIDVASGPAGWVAVGRVADAVAQGAPVDFHVATWTSRDGRTWTRAQRDPVFDQADPKALAAGPAGYVIVGTDVGDMKLDGETWAVAWTSPDGRTWTRSDREDALATGGFCDTLEWPGYGGMDDVAVLDDGTMVAVGTRVAGPVAADESCRHSTAAWRSDDGLAWQRMADFAEVPAGDTDIATDGTRLAALLGSTVATSADGHEWSTRQLPEGGVADPDLAIDGQDLVLADPTGIGRVGSILWRAEPGGDWMGEELPGVPLGTVRVAAIDVRDGVAAIVGWAEQFADGEAPSYSLVRRVRPPSPSIAPSPESLVDVARLRCNADGTSTLLTPSVRPQADGVHFITSNTTGLELAFDVEGIGGGAAFPGENENVWWQIPPGDVRIACYDSAAAGPPDDAYVSLTVVDPDGLFVSRALDCDEVAVGSDQWGEGATGWAGDPVELTRRLVATDQPTYEAVLSGYPVSDPRAVVVRDGSGPIARLLWGERNYGVWLPEMVSTCPGVDLALDYDALGPMATRPSPRPSLAAMGTLGGDLAWERAPDQASLVDAGMSAVAVGPDRYVAVGCATATEFNASECSGAAWWSSDGLDWQRAAVPDADHLYLGGVLAAPIGYVAWAYDVGAAFWFSSDGIEWQRAATIPSFSYDFVGNVVWFGGRFVALSEGNAPADAEPHIWVSDDGLTWHDQTDTVGCDGDQQRYDATGTPGSNAIVMGDQIVTVGSEYTGTEGSEYLGPDAYQRVVGRSSDGRCWSVERGPSGGWVNDLATFADGLVAVGKEHDPVGTGAGDPPPPSAAWVSPDGASWVTASLSEQPTGSLELVAAGDRGILALVETESGYWQWRSVDGETWSGSDASLKEVSDLVAVPGGFLAVGRETAADGGVTAIVWIAR